jgi:hypothetical protein
LRSIAVGKVASRGIGFGCIALSAALLAPYHISRISAGTSTQNDFLYVWLWGALLAVSAFLLALAIWRSRST